MPVAIRELIIQAELKEKDKPAAFKTTPPPNGNNGAVESNGELIPLSTLKQL